MLWAQMWSDGMLIDVLSVGDQVIVTGCSGSLQVHFSVVKSGDSLRATMQCFYRGGGPSQMSCHLLHQATAAVTWTGNVRI